MDKQLNLFLKILMRSKASRNRRLVYSVETSTLTICRSVCYRRFQQEVYCDIKAENVLWIFASLDERVSVMELQATEAFSDIDRTRALYGIIKLSLVVKEEVMQRIKPYIFKPCDKI
jgi:hypothetical protein